MIYFDNAATSRYKPRCVRKAAAKALRRSANPGRGSHKDAIDAARIVHETRKAVAEYVGAKKANVIFTKNCSEALNLAILGTAKLGGHVITTSLEHNSVLRPLNMLRKEGLISLTVLEVGREGVDLSDLRATINEKTYLIAVTAMSNVSGYTPPIREIGAIAAEKGISFLVDGAQGLGHIPIGFDDMQIDYLCGAGHKGLHGAQGSGFLVYRHDRFVSPIMYGGTGTESENPFQPTLPPESLESGTLNLIGITALREGIRWTAKHQTTLERNARRISDYLYEALSDFPQLSITSVKGTPILSFECKERATAEIADALNERYNVAIRYGAHCAPLARKSLGVRDVGTIRISIGANNTLRQAKYFIKALRAILEEG